MRSTSTGTTAASLSTCGDRHDGRAGFTLIEALVAMALLLAFVSVLGPHMFYARRIAEGIDGRIAAQALLRTILDAPFDRSEVTVGSRSGEVGDLSWTVTAEPMFVDAMVAPVDAPTLVATSQQAEPALKRKNWIAYRLTGTVSWAPGRMVVADTVRLGPEGEE
jgi:prepilin-type N-terminal cleavage/methylation domain-containing protein